MSISPLLRRFSSERLLYLSKSSSEPWISSLITCTALGTMSGVAYSQQIPGCWYVVAGLSMAAAVHIRHSFLRQHLKAVKITLSDQGKLAITLQNGTKLTTSLTELEISQEAEFPNDFKLLRSVKTASGSGFYVSYWAEMSEEGKKVLGMP